MEQKVNMFLWTVIVIVLLIGGGDFLETDKMIRYSLQVAMLGTLKREHLVTEEEYKKILDRIKKDFGIISHNSLDC